MISSLGREKHELIVLDIAVAVRYPDGLLTLDGEPSREASETHQAQLARFLACLALGAPPLTGAAAGILCGGADATAEVGISNDFVRDVARLIKPGTSVLFLLDEAANMNGVLRAITGLGGEILKTNVDAARARLIASTLAAPVDTTQPS